jgi:hypothetical protein
LSSLPFLFGLLPIPFSSAFIIFPFHFAFSLFIFDFCPNLSLQFPSYCIFTVGMESGMRQLCWWMSKTGHIIGSRFTSQFRSATRAARGSNHGQAFFSIFLPSPIKFHLYVLFHIASF